MQQPGGTPEGKNLILALVLSVGMLLAWQYFVVEPDIQRAEQQAAQQKLEQAKGETAPLQAAKIETAKETEAPEAPAPHVALESPSLTGGIGLKGARIDRLTLKDYYQDSEQSDNVSLLAPSNSELPYFAEFGWVSGTSGIEVPGRDTMWQTDGTELTPESPLMLYWTNPQGIRFEQKISLDEDFMFTVESRVINNSGQLVNLYPYGLINRTYLDDKEHFFILHEGPLAVLDETLQEISYEELRDDGPTKMQNTKGWLGITDKYWLTAMVPETTFNATFQHYNRSNSDKYQVDYLGQAHAIAPGENGEVTVRFFAGAKKVNMLDAYSEKYNIPLFDRAVDFGMLYFLTKPIFHALHYFHDLLGNFGLAIMLLTVCIKLVLFPLANKSYKAMSQMKVLMPKVQEIREQYKDDSLKMNQEMMALYKKEGVNPASGCLPMLLQLPIFFALYKVLFVTIEMRHAPFYGWINDLSAPDPTNVFTLFGLLEWGPPDFLHIGLWPLIMAATMVIQQKLNPKPTDPVQAQVMAWLPYIFLFLFAGFPAGLVIYWAWNNTLSIIQQYVITRRYRVQTDS